MKRRILVRTPSWLGDFVMAEPVVSELVAADVELTLAGPRRFLELLALPERVATLATDDGEGALSSWRGHHTALFLNGSTRSVVQAWLAGIRERVSWASSGRARFATRAITPARERGGTPIGLGIRGRAPRRLPRPFGSAALELANLLGRRCVLDRAPRLSANEAARASVAERLASLGVNDGFLLVNLGGREGGAKTVPDEVWRELLGGLASLAAEGRVVLCSGPGEEAQRPLRLAELGIPWDAPAPTLPELLALSERARHGLCADSGPRHLMAAAGLPLTVLYGATDPRHTALHTEHQRAFRRVVPCGPCHRERCPNVGREERRCFRELDLTAVARAVTGALG